MIFATPLYLAGAAGVLVPVLIHLFGRRRPRHVRFPSLMLLQAAQQRRRSPLRLRRLLALLMRMGAIVLLTAALAGPLVRSRLLAWLAPGGVIHALVLDTSASMSAGRPATAFDRARRAALEVLEALPPGSRVLVAAGGAALGPAADGRALSPEQAAAEVEQLTGGAQRSLLPGLVAEAAARMAQAGDPGALVCVTDLQASGWQGPPPEVAGPAPQVVVVDAGAPLANMALTDAQITDEVALRARPLTVRAEARAWGEPVGKRLPVTLQAGDVRVSAGVTPVADRPSWAELTFTPARAGLLTAAVGLPADDFALDDTRAVATVVRDRLRVLIVGDHARTGYLRAALDPFGGGAGSVVSVDVAGAESLSGRDLSPYDCVILADVPLPPASALDAIAFEVKRGMGALVFIGPEAVADRYADGVLPKLSMGGLEPGAVVRWPDGITLAEPGDDAGPLAVFADPAAGDLTAARFTAMRELPAPEGAPVAVRLRYADGTVAIAEGAHGLGRVMV
ncbi:MAG TPA: BatA and WFA domain-containing protein, partial [Armatimonadota bacterium]|nr:BatA and WFA domain-containing protein [Armatimonadota bacterium]